MPNRHGAPLQEPVVGAPSGCGWLGIIVLNMAGLRMGFFKRLQFAMENHNFSWVNYAKSPFFMGTLFKITVFHG